MANETYSMALTVNDYCETVDEPKPSWISITTITMVARQIIDPLDLKYVTACIQGKEFEIENGPTWAFRPPKPKKKNKKTTNFFNSISFGYRDTTTKSMKIFPNGSLQLTGATDITEGKKIFQQAIKVLKAALKIDDSRVDYDKIQIAMINTNFCLGFTLDLEAVTLLLQEQDYQASFTPDTYSAVTLRFHPIEGGNRITVNIFNSGSVIITGSNSLKEITAAYLMINRILRENYDIVFNPNCKVKVKEKTPIRFSKILRKACETGSKKWEDI